MQFFLDMSKVFDTIPLEKLCYKLPCYGIRGCTYTRVDCNEQYVIALQNDLNTITWWSQDWQ